MSWIASNNQLIDIERELNLRRLILLLYSIVCSAIVFTPRESDIFKGERKPVFKSFPLHCRRSRHLVGNQCCKFVQYSFINTAYRYIYTFVGTGSKRCVCELPLIHFDHFKMN